MKIIGTFVGFWRTEFLFWIRNLWIYKQKISKFAEKLKVTIASIYRFLQNWEWKLKMSTNKIYYVNINQIKI